MPAASEAAISKSQEAVLRNALDSLLVTFDGDLEARYRQHAHSRARDLISHSVYLLGLLYLVVVVPVMLLVDTAEMVAWRNYGVYPIAVALVALWCSTRLSWLKPHTVLVLYLALGLALTGTLLGAIRFDGLFPGQISAFETIYILIIGFSILRLPPRQTLTSCLCALAAALLVALLRQLPLPLLSMLLYFAIPLLICTLNGYILDISARRNFANNLLLESESAQLARWREQAERDTLRQQQLNLFPPRNCWNGCSATSLNKSTQKPAPRTRWKIRSWFAWRPGALMPMQKRAADFPGMKHCWGRPSIRSCWYSNTACRKDIWIWKWEKASVNLPLC